MGAGVDDIPHDVLDSCSKPQKHSYPHTYICCGSHHKTNIEVYSGTSDKGPSEIRTTSLLVAAPR